jgi:hypothetical protein|tara:strand:- start:1451 stop:1681 length:231 start_codon:yes stop_codon:yes gene_type:complete
MIKELIKLATHLDDKGLSKEADYLDAVIRKYSEHSEHSEHSELSDDEEYAMIREKLMRALTERSEAPIKTKKKKKG